MACTSDWSGMPMELLELIFKGLGDSTVDMSRFRAVCVTWELVASKAMPHYLNVSRPMLLAPSNKDNEVRRLFNLSNEEAYEIKLPKIQGTWCCTSWNNWLMTIDCTHPYSLNFLHLKSRLQIQLPTTMTFQDPPLDIVSTPIEAFIYKAMASCSPSDPNCIVMAIHSNWRKLAFCKPGDKRWITLQSEKRVTMRRGDKILEEKEINGYMDVIYYKGTFYAIGMLGIVRCDLEKCQVSTLIPQIKFSNYYYLVESCGDLLQVLRDLHWPNDVYKTRMFEILKLDFEENVWHEVNTLNGNALLLGHNLSVSISCREYPEFEEDCIYFTDDNFEGYFEEERGCHDMGIFNLKTRVIKPIFPSSEVWTSPLFWITK